MTNEALYILSDTLRTLLRFNATLGQTSLFNYKECVDRANTGEIKEEFVEIIEGKVEDEHENLKLHLIRMKEHLSTMVDIIEELGTEYEQER